MKRICSFMIAIRIIVLVWCNNCFDQSNRMKQDLYMEYHTYRKLNTSGVYGCAAECLMSSVCLSFSYNKHKHVCHLNDNNSTTDVSLMDGFTYSDISLWSSSLTGPCSGHQCSVTSPRCRVDRLHRPVCVPEFPGCGEPPVVDGAVSEHDGHFISAVTTYTCQEDFVKCPGTPSESVCQSTDEWDNLSGLCARITWQDPATGIDMHVPCGPSAQFQVNIEATLTEATVASILLIDDNDVLFRVAFINNYGAHVNRTVISTTIGGIWRAGENHPLSVSVGRVFNVTISLSQGVYDVTVDGAHLTSFAERVSEATVDFVIIKYAIDVHNLTYVSLL